MFGESLEVEPVHVPVPSITEHSRICAYKAVHCTYVVLCPVTVQLQLNMKHRTLLYLLYLYTQVRGNKCHVFALPLPVACSIHMSTMSSGT